MCFIESKFNVPTCSVKLQVVLCRIINSLPTYLISSYTSDLTFTLQLVRRKCLSDVVMHETKSVRKIVVKLVLTSRLFIPLKIMVNCFVMRLELIS